MIKLLRLGQPVNQLHRNGCSTVGELLDSLQQGLAPGEEVRVDGVVGNRNSRIHENSSITIVPAVKGGSA